MRIYYWLYAIVIGISVGYTQQLPIERLLKGEEFPVPRDVSLFGSEVFTGPTPFSALLENIEVGPDYVIGPGDEIKIYLWGKVEAVYSCIVDRRGEIFIEKLGKLSVGGLKFEALKSYLSRRFSQYYSNFTMDVTLGKLRTIKVFVVGEVKRPGAYDLSALATVFSALYCAGGVTKSGSMRQISLIRENKVIKTIDLYKFLLWGDKSEDERLQSGDTIFVPLIGPTVAVIGHVKRPAIYEIKEELKLSQALNLAGSPTSIADLTRVQLERIEGGERKVVDVTLSQLDKGEDIVLRDGDIIIIFPILTKMYEWVEVEGCVYKPGRYALETNLCLSSLLEKAQPKEEALLDHINIVRTHPDEHKEILTVSIDTAHTIKLHYRDRVIVHSIWEGKKRGYVRIEGLVRHCGEYELVENMKVSDLILLAGGVSDVKDLAALQGYVIRVTHTTTAKKSQQIIPFSVKDLLAKKVQDISLVDNDMVVIYSIWAVEPKEKVKIFGEVLRPGEYELSEGMYVSDLVYIAGGLKKSASLLSCEFRRRKKNGETITWTYLNINPQLILEDINHPSNIPLREGDELYVWSIPQWDRPYTVQIKGQIKYPGVYTISKGERISQLIKRAGGFLEGAYPGGARLLRVQEQVHQQTIKTQFLTDEERNLLYSKIFILETPTWTYQAYTQLSAARFTPGKIIIDLSNIKEFSPADIELCDGDVIEIPCAPTSVSVIGEVYNPGSVLYKKGAGLNYYLNMVGGMMETANKRAIYVIRFNGEVVKRLSFYRPQPGDTIVVPAQMKERMTFGQFLILTLDTLFKTASILAVVATVF